MGHPGRVAVVLGIEEIMKHTTARTKKYFYASAAAALGPRMSPARVKKFGRKMLGLSSSAANQFADVYRDIQSGRISKTGRFGEFAHLRKP